MPHKRKAEDVDDIIQSVDIEDGWTLKLLNLDRDELALILGELSNQAKINIQDLKRAKRWLPSFSTTSNINLEPFQTPVYQLPPSFHKAVFERSWHAQDVYQEIQKQNREETRLRLLDMYIVPILALFQGRIIDTPERTLPETEFSTGGEVEHEIIMIGGILILVVELKLDHLTGNNTPQLFLELLSAAKLNEGIQFEGLRIYGLLTNQTHFMFYSYNPITKKFYQDEELFVNVTRDQFLRNMIRASNKIFGLVLFAFIEGLRAIVQHSKHRAVNGNFTAASSGLLGSLPAQDSQPTCETSTAIGRPGRKSTDEWELALKLAEQCSAKFGERVTGLEDMERKSNEALDILTQCVRSIPRISAFTGETDAQLTSAQLKDLAGRVVDEELQKLV